VAREVALLDLSVLQLRRPTPAMLTGWKWPRFDEPRVEALYQRHSALSHLAVGWWVMLAGWTGLLAVGLGTWVNPTDRDAPARRLTVWQSVVVSLSILGLGLSLWALRATENRSRHLFWCALEACQVRYLIAKQQERRLQELTQKLREVRQEEEKQQERRLQELTQKLREVRQEEEMMYAMLFRGQTRARSAYSTSRSGFLLAAPEARSITRSVEGSPELAIPLALSEGKTDWDAARRAATRLRDPKYGLRDFYMDVRQAFPELQLYTVLHEEVRAIRPTNH